MIPLKLKHFMKIKTKIHFHYPIYTNNQIYYATKAHTLPSHTQITADKIVSRNNSTLKLMVEATKICYILLEVRMRISTEYSALNKRWLKFKPVTSCHIVILYQLNKKFKPIIKTLIYIIKLIPNLSIILFFKT